MKMEKNREVERNIGSEKSTKKNKSPYDSRIDFLQEEFGLSNQEVDGMKEFLEDPAFSKKKRTMREVLDTITDTDRLNIRQKMALSYSIGMFQAENNLTKIPVIKMPIIPYVIPDMPGSGG